MNTESGFSCFSYKLAEVTAGSHIQPVNWRESHYHKDLGETVTSRWLVKWHKPDADEKWLPVLPTRSLTVNMSKKQQEHVQAAFVKLASGKQGSDGSVVALRGEGAVSDQLTVILRTSTLDVLAMGLMPQLPTVGKFCYYHSVGT